MCGLYCYVCVYVCMHDVCKRHGDMKLAPFLLVPTCCLLFRVDDVGSCSCPFPFHLARGI
jgi:hypothetical protein